MAECAEMNRVFSADWSKMDGITYLKGIIIKKCSQEERSSDIMNTFTLNG